MSDRGQPLEHDLVTRFEVRRGSFTIPAEVLAEADLGDDYRLRRAFAIGLPEVPARPRGVLNTTRRVQRDGSAFVSWRLILIHTRRA